MNIAIVGSGGREHTFAWKLRQSPQCEKLYIIPGNAGTAQEGENVDIDPSDFEKLALFLIHNHVDLLVVGPEAPLVAGIRDRLEADEKLKHLRIVGPGQAGAELEGSKDFAKRFMLKHNIPAAASATFTRDTLVDAKAYLQDHPLPVVLKADGLAAGKGVIICHSREEAISTLHSMLIEQRFGTASARVVIEQFLEGIEVSVFALADGNSYILLPEAKDYKPIGENNTGPNTGGMGSVSPVNFAQGTFLQKVEERIVIPTVNGLKADGIDYCGFIFFGLINVNGEPFVIEYNARMGDPETQVVLPRIKSDFVDLLMATADRKLQDVVLQVDERTATTVVMVAGGYPDEYEKGAAIQGLQTSQPDTMVFHAGTTQSEGKVKTAGGRVLAITALGHSMQEALEKSYNRLAHIQWKDAYYRKDIGRDLIALQ
jgi:phosphoribosylamine--glycine ligase